MLKKIAYIVIAILAAVLIIGWIITRPDVADHTTDELSGPDPVLSAAEPETIPTISIAEVVGWADGETPQAPDGFTVQRFADGLDHPRSLLRLPNGDILVAEADAPPSDASGIKAWIADRLMKRAGSGTRPSANRITLLRDIDGDGAADLKVAYLTGLNSPFGMALVGDTLYVANTDAIIAYPYVEGDTSIADRGTRIVSLPAAAPNQHWTRGLLAETDGSKLYVSVGANSNVAEKGIEGEQCKLRRDLPPEICRGAILEIDLATRSMRGYATGLRNPVGMAWSPADHSLWVVVNERDMLGSDLVPDYMTSVELGDFFGWPWYYWGGYEDKRVSATAPMDMRQYSKRPDYALGSHTAPLGIAFAARANLGAPYENGAFVALHGSWNREPPAGYKVVFVAFDGNEPADAKPIDVLTGFLNQEGKARGRPVDVAVAADGSLLVTDDVGNIVWRVSRGEGDNPSS